jgi:hypothetical protein
MRRRSPRRAPEQELERILGLFRDLTDQSSLTRKAAHHYGTRDIELAEASATRRTGSM